MGNRSPATSPSPVASGGNSPIQHAPTLTIPNPIVFVPAQQQESQVNDIYLTATL